MSSRDLGLAVLLLGLLLVAYLPALNGGPVWDDDAHLTRPELQSWRGLGRIWFQAGSTQQYYPLLHSAFWLEHRWWGDAVLGYHLMNLALHATACLLLVVILRRLAFPAAWLAAFLFALHPVSVESVAWITEQKNTLSNLFYLVSALVYLDFDRTRRRSKYFIAAGLFLAALLTKSVTATLPAALLLVFWWKRGRLDVKRDVRPLVPWFALAIAAGIVTAWVERHFVGAEGARFTLGMADRVLLAGRVVWFYFAKLVWPVNLMFVYPRWALDPAAWWQWLFPLGAIAAACALLALAIRKKLRGPLAGFLFFAGTLVPVLGFLNVYPFVFSFVADHFQYQASLGILVPLSWALMRAARKAQWVPGAIVAVLVVLTWNHSGTFRDAGALYRDTLARNPDSWLAHNNLASLLGRVPGHSEEAMEHVDAALRIYPDSAEAHMNRGVLLLDMPGRMEDAIAEFRAALRLNPSYALAHNDLGGALAQMPGRNEEAIAEFRAALRILPDYAEAHANLGTVLAKMPGRTAEAVEQFQAALELRPDMVELRPLLQNLQQQTR